MGQRQARQFRRQLRLDVRRMRAQGQHPTTIASTVVIHTRHWVMPNAWANVSVKSALKSAATVTGVPMERHTHRGSVVNYWPPAMGETWQWRRQRHMRAAESASGAGDV